MTDKEKVIMRMIVELWNAYNCLPALNADDKDDFRFYIHRMQEMIASRQELFNYTP